MWTTGVDAAFPPGAWDEIASDRDVGDSQVVLAFAAGRRRESAALVGATIEPEPHLFAVATFEDPERVDPILVIEALRHAWQDYAVVTVLIHESDWGWVVARLAEEGLPLEIVPKSPARLANSWQELYDAVLEHRVTHDGTRDFARHVGRLSLVDGPAGPRPEINAEAPVAAALAALVAFDGVLRTEPASTPKIHAWRAQ